MLKWVVLVAIVVIALYAVIVDGQVLVGLDDPLLIKEIESDQLIQVTNAGYYKQRFRGDIDEDPRLEVWTYQTPSKDLGYQIVLREGKSLRSIGYGPESEARTFTTQDE